MGFLAHQSAVPVSVPVFAAFLGSRQVVALKDSLVFGCNTPASASVESSAEIRFAAPLAQLGSLSGNVVWVGVHGPS